MRHVNLQWMIDRVPNGGTLWTIETLWTERWTICRDRFKRRRERGTVCAERFERRTERWTVCTERFSGVVVLFRVCINIYAQHVVTSRMAHDTQHLSLIWFPFKHNSLYFLSVSLWQSSKTISTCTLWGNFNMMFDSFGLSLYIHCITSGKELCIGTGFKWTKVMMISI
jgi:hypothetical protein